MSVQESGLSLRNELLARASRVALAPEVNHTFFQSTGKTAYDAILREHGSALDMVFDGLGMKLRMVKDRNERLRVQGSRVIVAGGIEILRRFRQNEGFWPNREANKAALTQGVDDFLAGREKGAATAIALVVPDVIQSYNPGYAMFAYEQLDRLRSDKAPPDVRMIATGMLDVLRPALPPAHTV